MKKETFNLIIRALIGVAASLLIVGAMGLITQSQGEAPLLQQASGVKASQTAMSVSGVDISAEEYFYTVAMQAQTLASYGITDLSLEVGEGMTAADLAVSQAENQLVGSAVLRGWAAELGVSLTDADKATLAEQKALYGDEAAFRQMLKLAGTSETVFDNVMGDQLLFNHLYELYCPAGAAQRPDNAALEALAEEHKLVSAYVLVLDAAAEDAKVKMEGYAARLAAAENKEEEFLACAAELECDSTVQTYDCCHSAPLNDALLALAVGESGAVVEADGALYVPVRTDLDLDTVAYVHFNEEYNRRISVASVEHNEALLDRVDVAAFYAKYIQLQQNTYAAMMQG